MHLYAIPIIVVIIGLTLHVVLGGSDFGAGPGAFRVRALIVAVLAGGLSIALLPILLPHLTIAQAASPTATLVAVLASSRRGLAARGAIAGLLGGLGFLTVTTAPWAHIIGVVSLLICAVCALLAVGPAELGAHEEPPAG